MKSFFKGILTFVVSIGILLLVFLIFHSKIIVPVFPIIIGAMAYYATKTQRVLIKKNYTPINNLSEGLVKIEGKVNAQTTLETPYFKDECIGYSYERAEIDYYEDGDERTVSSIYKIDFPDFYLSDATGKIKVKADGLDVTFLSVKTKKIKKIRHSERTLKNGDEITILGTIVKNNRNEFELQKSEENPFTISYKTIISKQEKSFEIIKFLLPYLILMYVGVNYFLFFAPIKTHFGKSDAFSYFSIFGMPVLALIFGYIGNNSDGYMKVLFSIFASICFSVSFLSVPLIFLFLMIKLEFYRIICIWITIFVCTTLAFVINFKRLDGVFEKR